MNALTLCTAKTRNPLKLAMVSGVTEGGRGGQLPPGAAGKGAQNSLAKNIL